MELTWMGRHRASVEVMIKMCNSYAALLSIPSFVWEDISLSVQELQTLEYILENENQRENMSRVAEKMNFSQSNFSKIVKQLVIKGMVEKYHSARNGKDIILCPSELGREAYAAYSASAQARWMPIFEHMDALSPDDEEVLIKICKAFTERCSNQLASYNARKARGGTEETDTLIKIE